jgi:hypothetical protein
VSDFPAPEFCGHNDSIRTHVQTVLVNFSKTGIGPPRLFLRAEVWCELCNRDYTFLGYRADKARLDRPYIPAPRKGCRLEAPLALGGKRETT